jgi:hypothetical protein
VVTVLAGSVVVRVSVVPDRVKVEMIVAGGTTEVVVMVESIVLGGNCVVMISVEAGNVDTVVTVTTGRVIVDTKELIEVETLVTV